MFHVQIDKIVLFTTKIEIKSRICNTANQQCGYMEETNGL